MVRDERSKEVQSTELRIQKNFPLANLIIETKEGKLWLNSPDCSLRIKNLEFENIEEKFSSIDINDSKVIMAGETNKDDEFDNNIVELTTFLVNKIYLKQGEIKNMDDFFSDLTVLCKAYIDKED